MDRRYTGFMFALFIYPFRADVALLPIVAGNLMEGVRNLAIGGTSVIIVVGVALETVKALEAQMMMRLCNCRQGDMTLIWKQ